MEPYMFEQEKGRREGRKDRPDMCQEAKHQPQCPKEPWRKTKLLGLSRKRNSLLFS